MSVELMMPSNHLILCRPLLLLPSIFPSIRVFSSESAFCIRWPKYYSFSFSISPSSECLGLISLRIDLFDPLAVWGTLKHFLQHHSLKESILWCSAFFMVQLSHPYMTTGKTSYFISTKTYLLKDRCCVLFFCVCLACNSTWHIYMLNNYLLMDAFIMHQGPQSYLPPIPPLDLSF